MEKAWDVDECLQPYLHSSDQATANECLDRLLDKIAKPIIQQIVLRTLRQEPVDDARGILPPDAEDATGDVLVRILPRLYALRADPIGHAISDFRALVATATYRTLTDKRRQNNRHRANQEKKIRRLFAANESLAMWKDHHGRIVCGYSVWRDKGLRASASREELASGADLPSLVEPSPSGNYERSTAEAVLSILERVGYPIRLNDLISATCGRQSAEAETISIDALNDEDNPALSSVQNPRDILETRRLLDLLFEEIQKLNSAQRKSFLLNMSDSHGYSIEWFLFTDIATKEQLAGLLEVSLDDFRDLLDGLPMTDRDVGKLLGIDSVRVTNIRKAVRARLERRRATFLGKVRK